MIAGAITAAGMSLVELLRASASTVFWKNVVFVSGGALFLALPVVVLVIGPIYNALRTADSMGKEYALERKAFIGRAFCWFLGAGLMLALSSFLG